MPDDTFSVAPMMDYTDRHLRYLLRLVSKRATLYTEMVTANTIVHNDDLDRWLGFSDPHEHPVVLQLGGNDPAALALAVAKSRSYAYAAVNLNCGCPSERVAGGGCFGAALMREPALVADLCAAMAAESGGVPITVKCRVGVVDRDDVGGGVGLSSRLDQDEEADYAALAHFVDAVASGGGGVEHFVVHARKAVLGGLSPDANRKVPPLKHGFAGRLAADFPALRFSLNGGLETLGDCQKHLQSHLDDAPSRPAYRVGPLHGVMLGRAAVARPWHLLASVDEVLYREPPPDGNHLTRRQVIAAYSVYAEDQLETCRRVQPAYARKLCRQLVRPVANLFAGEPGGARFRQALENALQADAYARAGAAGGVAAVLAAACAGLQPHVLDAPPPHVLLAAQRAAEQAGAASPALERAP